MPSHLEDAHAIQQLLNTYSQYGSLGDWDRTMATYLPHGVWAIPHLGLKFTGQAEVRAALEAFAAHMDYVLQNNAPALIEIDGDRATARSGIVERGKRAGLDEGFEYLGIYADELERTAGGWKFARRTFEGIGSGFFPLRPENAAP